ncbi:ribonuclease N [Saccharopolyspora sp. K220]|uniref:ribonuclease domain-containing protein n=1 Tax=Saccharopolyspora soli TaxID=2926618 RepID=UPI001F57261F|nr:ribonuclease domain-containing protein [Saccharopolyspora soli]MCI2419323.1 ribonuclease N [Saccharopolyspora soli]
MSNRNRSVLTLLKLLVATFAVTGLLGVGVATAPAANADVYDSCTHSGCAEARDSNEIWASMGYPGSRDWYDWPDGQCNFAGGTYNNYEAELPEGHSYREFDVTPRACGAARQAYRLVVDLTTGEVYFSPNHYDDFYRL